MLKKTFFFLLIVFALILTRSFFAGPRETATYKLWDKDEDIDNLAWQAQDWDPKQQPINIQTIQTGTISTTKAPGLTQPVTPRTSHPILTPQEQAKEIENKVIHLNSKIEAQKFFFDQLNNTGTDPFTGKKDKQTIANSLRKIQTNLENIVREAQRENILNLIDYAEIQEVQKNIDTYLKIASYK
ncbi:MAG: hypothetical protein ABH827_02315 [bacterium]